MAPHSSERRSFLRTLLLAPLAVWLGRGRTLFAAGTSEAEIQKNLVKATDPMPGALKFHADAKTAPKDLRKSDDMLCKNCAQYTKKGTLKGKEMGTCTLFNGGYVPSEGWCMSWAKKS